MMPNLKIPPFLKCKFQNSTLMAIAAGIGAAIGYGFLPWYWIIPLLIGMICFNLRQIIIVAAAFILCFSSGAINAYLERKTDKNIPAARSLISGEVFCKDRRLSALDMLYRPYVINGEVTVNGKSFDANIIYPDNLPLFYGDNHEFTGTVTPPVPAGLICRDGEITGSIAPFYGNKPLIKITAIKPAAQRFSMLRTHFKCRDWLLVRIVKNIRNAETADMAARLFLGASRGGSPVNRKNFIISGTIHLFSVSGLHVTLIAMIILLLLRLAPFEWRYRISAIFILLYVLLSGASLPAVRAGAMAILWCILRSKLYPSSSWNAIMYVWSAFAFIAPDTVASLSAQYSFGISAALILLMEKIPAIFQRQHEIIAMMPNNSPMTAKKRRLFSLSQNSIVVVLVSMTAFAAGAGISLYRQNLFVPGSILANLLLILFSPVLFGALFFKVIAGMIYSGFDQLGALILEGTFHLLTEFTGTVARIFTPHPASAPPLWSVAIYYLLLCGTLGPKSLKINFFSLIGVLLMLCIWYYPDPADKPLVTVVSHGSSTPAAISYRRPGNGTALIADVPQRAAALLTGKLLKEQGVHFAQVNFSGTNASSNRGLDALASQLDVSIGGTEVKRKPGRAFIRNLREYYRDKELTAPTFPLHKPDKNSVICEFPGGVKVFSQSTISGRKIEVTMPSGEVKRELMPWCSLPVVWQCEIK